MFSSLIIAILAAILFPVFAKAREKARQASCLSNVKQLCLGFLQYVQDYDEMLPQGAEVSWSATAGMSGFFGNAVYPYVKNTQIYICPSTTGYSNTWRNIGYVAASYGYNTMLLQDGSNGAMASFPNVSETVLLLDARNPWIDGVGTNADSGVYGRIGDGYFGGAATDWHNDGINVGFLDGHGKWSKVSGLKYCNFRWVTQSTSHADYARGQKSISTPY